MINVGIFIKYDEGNYNRIELFNDEKISVNSSIQNINDIAKTFTDYSQTFTIPASVKNNRIFKHWYENSLDNQFSTLVKADAYIELDTILFRTGKIQLEGCSIVNNRPQNYSITFIGVLGSLKDKFAGLYLKDLTSTAYDFNYSATIIKDKVTSTAISDDIMFPLISSEDYWTYGSGSFDINNSSTPINYLDLFPAIRLKAVFEMINSQFGINFTGTFLNDIRFKAAYLWLKNADTFEIKPILIPVTYDTSGTFTQVSGTTSVFNLWFSYPFANAFITYNGNIADIPANYIYYRRKAIVNVIPTIAGVKYKVKIFKQNDLTSSKSLYYTSVLTTSIVGTQSFTVFDSIVYSYQNNNVYTVEIETEGSITFDSYIRLESRRTAGFTYYWYQNLSKTSTQTILFPLAVKYYMPDIKIEDFFSGILKMFNLTCYSFDGVNYTVEQLEDYYNSGKIVDITKHIKSDNINLTRVKTYKKINFEYEKSESLVNVGFMSANGVEYGSLLYNTENDGDEYSIKLPFEDLNFNNLNDKLQVGYALKTDLQKYIPKPVILYDYNPTALTNITGSFYFQIPSGTTVHSDYKAFGQEFFNGTDTLFSLNFNSQQSTLTNEVINNSLYNQYYENYFANIFNIKSRLFKVSAMLPISLLTSLKLNDRLKIRDKKYIINTMNTDLTTGEVQFELLTDFRIIQSEVTSFDISVGLKSCVDGFITFATAYPATVYSDSTTLGLGVLLYTDIGLINLLTSPAIKVDTDIYDLSSGEIIGFSTDGEAC